MIDILEKGIKKRPALQGPEKIGEILKEIQRSMGNPEKDRAKKRNAKYKEIAQANINDDFHLQIPTEPTQIPKKKEREMQRTAELAERNATQRNARNGQTGAHCVDFEVEIGE